MNLTENQKQSYSMLANCIRALSADAVEKARSGHPGMPLGMADVMTVLAFDFLKFNPQQPRWFNRDRLVLSAGHGSMLLYAFYYLAGYWDFSLDDIKRFRQLNSKAAGHPEFGTYTAIETTTGPLGQGLANSVGIAIAGRKYQQRLGKEICNHKVYCIVGDGCLMEGISYESASLAGHLQLDNLVVLFDDNQISIDGPTSLSVSEDHLKKFEALGWEVERIDGHDFTAINAALSRAQNASKPYFIACRTIIGKGAAKKAGSEAAHGAPLGKDEIIALKNYIGFPQEEFYVPVELKTIWEKAWLRNKDIYNSWLEAYKVLGEQEKEYLLPAKISAQILTEIAAIKPEKDEATRQSSGKLLDKLMQLHEKIICGSADLSHSNNIKSLHSKVITSNDFSGNFIHYGVRENAMAGIMNGLAVSGFLPIGGTFFVFTDYMRPAIRLSAIMRQQVIYVMTHDSIGVGEDGETHQPIEHLASFRAMPGVIVLRPADFIETLECWQIAIENRNQPSMLVLTRQETAQVRELAKENLCAKGAYILAEDNESQVDVTIFATGSELAIATSVKKLLNQQELAIRVVSIPCFELLFAQEEVYIQRLLSNTKLRVGIEAASSFGWSKIIGEDGIFFGIDEFGHSAPAKELFRYYGLESDIIAEKITAQLKKQR